MIKDSKIKKSATQFQEYTKAMPPKKKKMFGLIALIVVIFAISVTVMLNAKRSEYTILYTGMAPTESTEIFNVLIRMGADVKRSPEGDVMVPTEELDTWLFQLAMEDYPKTTLGYDVFGEHTGMTATESEREQWYLYQLQDRVQATLKRVDGISDAVVNISLAESSNNIWDEATTSATGTASVLLTLEQGVELSPSQVTGIKNLVAFGVPKMTPEVVQVIDSRTSLRLEGEDEVTNISSNQNIEFEQIVQEQLEDNIERLLAPRYGAGGVVATAKVTINYDKMITEQLELREKPEGGGYETHTNGEYTIDGNVSLGGIVGEENNTDIPGYSYTNPDGEDTTYFAWDTDIDYSYFKTQIEKGQAELERATVSVMVDEDNMTQAIRAELVNLVSKSTDIPMDLIFVSAFEAPVEETEEPQEETSDNIFVNMPLWMVITGVVVLLLIIVAIVVVILFGRNKKQKKDSEMDRVLKEQEAQSQQEIEEYKKQLSAAAKVGENAKSDAIVEEIRDFAKGNPQITANLLRSWLKEGE